MEEETDLKEYLANHRFLVNTFSHCLVVTPLLHCCVYLSVNKIFLAITTTPLSDLLRRPEKGLTFVQIY